MARILGVALVAAALAWVLLPQRVAPRAVPEGEHATAPDARPDAHAFRVVGWGQPNTVPHLEAMGVEFRHVEVDLMASTGGTLVGAHDPEKLARIDSGAIARPLTLDHLLGLPYDSFFLDMKDTLPPEDAGPGFFDRAERSVALAVDRIVAGGRRGDAFVMVYAVTGKMVAHARERGVDLMLQGYPPDEASTLALVRRAAAHGITRVCVPLVRTTPAVLEESRRLGVAHIPYTFLEEPWEPAEFRWRIGEHLAGIILPPGDHHRRFIELLAE